jgi:hypothetical protein
MANSNFVVHNGLTVGPLTIDAATGSISTTGTVSVAGIAVSAISQNDSSISINDTGTGSNVSIVIDGATEHVLTQYLTTLNGNLLVNSTGYMTVPAGTSAQRPATPSVGMMRYNSTITSFEGYYAGAWSSLGGVKSVDGKAYITAEASAGAGDDVIRVYSGSTGTSTQVMWASVGNVSILPSTELTAPGTGALQVAGGASFGGNAYVANNLYIGANAFGKALNVPTIIAADNGSTYAQMAMINTASTGSSDFAAYANNGDDSGGWVDLGIAGSGFNDPAYTITKAQDGYIIVRPTGSTYGGNLVIGTSEAGSYNDVAISVGSFFANAEVARFHGNATTSGYLALKQGTASSSTTTGALVVTGGVGISGALNIGGATALSSALTYGGVTLTNAVTGTGKMVLDTSPTISGLTTTGTLSAAAITASGATSITNSTTSISSSTGAVVVTGGVGIGGNLNVGGTNHTINGDTTIGGNLTVQGATSQVGSSNLTINDSIIDLHTFANLAPLTSDDGRDVGMKFHYYKSAMGGDQSAFLGWANDTGSLEWYVAGTEVANVFTGTAYGTIKSGEYVAANTTASTSTTTGALRVAGGAGIAGAAFIGGRTTTAGLTTSATILASANNTLDIGAAGTTFATVYATTFSGVSTTAKYADLAENYQADKAYAPGTVVMFGGAQEVTVADADATAVAGVVSTNPAHLMNGGLTGVNVVPLALQGRVPCNVIGPVKKGDLMVSAGFGYAKTNNTPAVGTVIGKALNDFNGAKGQIEVVVGRV